MQFFEKNHLEAYHAFNNQAKRYSFKPSSFTFFVAAPIVFYLLNYFYPSEMFETAFNIFSFIFVVIATIMLLFPFIDKNEFVKKIATKTIDENIERKNRDNALVYILTSPNTLFYYGSVVILFLSNQPIGFCIAIISVVLELSHSTSYEASLKEEIGKQFMLKEKFESNKENK